MWNVKPNHIQSTENAVNALHEVVGDHTKKRKPFKRDFCWKKNYTSIHRQYNNFMQLSHSLPLFFFTKLLYCAMVHTEKKSEERKREIASNEQNKNIQQNRNIKTNYRIQKRYTFRSFEFQTYVGKIQSKLTTPTQFQLIKYTLVSINAFFNAWMLIYEYTDVPMESLYILLFLILVSLSNIYIRCVWTENDNNINNSNQISNTKTYLNPLFNIRLSFPATWCVKKGRDAHAKPTGCMEH